MFFTFFFVLCQFVEGSFEKYLERLEDPKVCCCNINDDATSQLQMTEDEVTIYNVFEFIKENWAKTLMKDKVTTETYS